MRSSPLTDFRILMKPELTYSREPVEFWEPPSRWGGVNWTLRPSEIVGPPQTYLRPLGVSPWRFTTTSHPHPLTTPTPTHTPLHSYFTPTATLTHTHTHTTHTHTHTPSLLLHTDSHPHTPPPHTHTPHTHQHTHPFTPTSHRHPPPHTHTPLHSYFTPTATLTHTHHTHTPLHSYFTPTAPPPSPATHPLPPYTCLFGIFKPGSFQPAIHHPPRLPLVSDIGRFHCLAPR